ncbi:zinc finger BED domain-containing protein 5-like [Pseudochaenichthys georgianus]|uniref:zinc finger BED domain-containing protein 5-like n=1 Tax=Pseudochaenichthys georgianus TaxID=52239 RepID=UPI0039C12B2F
MSEKRKGDDSSSAIKKKMRTYLESYLNFGFMEGTDKTRPECVICREKLANESMKPSKMKRHQQTMHPETVGRDRDFFIKKQHLAKANKPMDIRTAFVRAGSDAQKATEASFECALLIAKAKKPHNIGEQLIKPACIKMVEKLCDPQVAEKLKTVPLSNNTVKDRIDKMALASKKLSEDLSETLSTVVKIVNFIKGRPTNKRLFADLCEDEAHQTLLLHTEVRWLSRGRVLARFHTWPTSSVNETNKRLQGVESNILQCKETLDAFVRKLEYRVRKMERGELQQFPLLLKQSQNNPETVPVSVRREFIRHMNALQTEMQSRFADIDEYVSKELWVLDPFIAKIEDVEYLDCEDELTDIQADSLSKKYFQEKGFKKFWIVKGPSLAPKLTLHATTRIILPFSTTYLSETAFSALVAIKTKARNTLDVHNDFRLAVTHITPDIPGCGRASPSFFIQRESR